MKILCTGGAGFIGSTLVKFLLESENISKVTVFDNLLYEKTSLLPYVSNSKFEFVKGDVRDDAYLLKQVAKHDAILSLAALVGAKLCDDNPVDAELVNFRANKVICDNKSKDQLIYYFNTNSGYGSTTGNKPITEEDELNPISLYGRTKVAAEKVIKNTNNFIICRLATVFGSSPRPRTDLLVNNLVLKAIQDKVLVIYESENMRNYIHVMDVARSVIHCLDNDKCLNQIFNVGNDAINMSKMQLCKKIKNHIDVEIIKANYTSDPDKRNYIVSSQKLYNTGFTCKYSLDYGIEELIKCYKLINTTLYSNY